MGRDLPLIKINKSFILNNVEILSFLNETKFFHQKSEARRAIENKAIKINDELVRDYKDHLSIKDFVDEKRLKISFGKKKLFGRIKIVYFFYSFLYKSWCYSS